MCWITLGSIKPVKSLLCDFPNVSLKKEMHPICFSFNSSDWYYFRTWAFYTLKVWTNGKKMFLEHLLPGDWALSDLRRAVECSGSGQGPTPSVWLNKIRPCHCIPPLRSPDRIKYSWATADS